MAGTSGRLGPRSAGASERWKLERKDAGTLLVLADARAPRHIAASR